MAPTPPTEPAARHTSTLHHRVEELLGELAGRYVPDERLAQVGRLATAIDLLRHMPGPFGAIPALPVALPHDRAELAAIITSELAQRPTAELAQLITLTHLTTGAWLAEYEASMDPEPEPAPAPDPAPDPIPERSEETTTHDAIPGDVAGDA